MRETERVQEWKREREMEWKRERERENTNESNKNRFSITPTNRVWPFTSYLFLEKTRKTFFVQKVMKAEGEKSVLL